MNLIRPTLFCFWLLTLTGLAFGQVETPAFGKQKSASFEQKRPVSTVIFPKLGLVSVTSGVTSCCTAIIVDIDAKTLTVRSGAGAIAGEPTAEQKVVSLEPLELAALIGRSNNLWSTARTYWEAKCGDIPCRPSLDYITEIWLVDGEIFRYDSSLNPVDQTGEFYLLRELLTKIAYPKK